MARPAGHRVMIEVKEIEKTSQGGIILAAKTILDEKRAIEKGKVVALGNSAYKDFSGDPWVKVGDIVWFKKYAGLKIDENLIIIEDEDIYAIDDSEETKETKEVSSK